MTDFNCTSIYWSQDHWNCEPNHHFVLALGVILTVLLALWMIKKRKKHQPSIRELLQELIQIEQENNAILRHIRICLCPQLSHFEVKLMDANITVGQTTTATVVNAVDQFGQPFPVDLSTIVWSLSDPALATQNPQPDGSNPVTAVAAGSEQVIATIGGKSNFGTLTISIPAPTLASFDVNFSSPTP